jgi:hypothetical protein
MMKERRYYVTLFEVYEETVEVLARDRDHALEKARGGLGAPVERSHAYELKDEAAVVNMEGEE